MEVLNLKFNKFIFIGFYNESCLLKIINQKYCGKIFNRYVFKNLYGKNIILILLFLQDFVILKIVFKKNYNIVNIWFSKF